MKMKLLALAVAGAFVAPVAMAEHEEGVPANALGNVTIYGQVNASFGIVRDGAVAGASAPVGDFTGSTTRNQVSSDASRLGVKGSEDLGIGTSAIWQIESRVDVDGSNSATLGTRNTFVGLSGAGWGTAILGRHDTPYKVATRGLDLFADTIADNRSLMGMTGGGIASHDIRPTDVLAYISPNMGGFTVALAYVAGAEQAFASDFPNCCDKKGDAWSGYGMYNAGPINASLSYQRVNGGSNAGGFTGFTNSAQTVPFGIGDDHDATAWKLGGGYTMDAFAVNAAYEHTTGDLGGGDTLDQNNWYLAGKFNFTPNDAVKLAYTHAGKAHQASVDEVADSDAHQWSVGYDHNLSKRTMVYALYTKLNNGGNAQYALNPSAITDVTGGVSGGAGSDPSAFALGIKHSF